MTTTHRRPRTRSLLAVAALLGSGLTGLAGLAGQPAGAAVPTSASRAQCTSHTVGPTSTQQQIVAAIDAAAAERTHPSWAVGPTGARQGVVYLRPGRYRIAPITFLAARSNVRLVFDPGVLVRPAAGADADLFTLGSATSRVRNVSFVAGDRCGNADFAGSDLANVWADTAERGNDPGVYDTVAAGKVAGMANLPLGGQPGWPRSRLARMWVLDLDPAGDLATASDDFEQDVAGFQITNADGVDIADVVSYQNAARLVKVKRDGSTSPVGPVEGRTSRTTVVMIEPDWPSYTEGDYPAPRRVSLANLYNVLAPSGWGPEQVRVCQDCHVDSVFSHGGIALRFETDGGGKSAAATARRCDGAGVSGSGSDITGVYGNAVVSFVPHCRHNGEVEVSGVKGYSQTTLVALGKPETATAGFDSVLVSGVTGCGSGSALTAQAPLPKVNTYDLAASLDAVTAPPSYVTGAGLWQWPSRPLGQAGGLPTDVPPGATYRASSIAC